MSIDLSKLSVTELYEIYRDLVSALDRKGVSEAHYEYFVQLYDKVLDAFYTTKANTAQESLLKMVELGKEDLGNCSIFAPATLKEAQQFVGKRT